MKASDYIAEFLALNGVTTVFEMTGGMITHLLDSLGARDDVNVVSMHHEQAAAFAAEGNARITGIPGVALATSGPGATNLITGIGSCFFDSVPAVFITGQVNTHELTGASGVRQSGFQETDIVAVAAPITKGAWRVGSAEELPDLLAAAFRLVREGRPGPVLLDVPMDVQRQQVEECVPTLGGPDRTSPVDVSGALEALALAERPLIVAGGGVRAALADERLREFAERTGIPVACSLMGLDVLPSEHPLQVGFIGTYGNRWANLALRDADCLLVLGARLDVRQTGADPVAFRGDKTIVRVDIDAAQVNWRVWTDIEVIADVGEFLAQALTATSGRDVKNRSAWLREIASHRLAWPQNRELADIDGINPSDFLDALSASAHGASAFVVDVGQNQMWAAQSLRLSEGQRFLTSGGMGAMGFALPTSIGVSTATPGKPVVVVVGDGGVQVNIQELETISRLGLPVKIVVLNNGCLGMVRQFQDEYFDSRHQSTVWGYGVPDLVAVSEAYRIPARRLDTPDGTDEAVRWLMADREGPALLEVTISGRSCVRPKVAYGRPVYEMDPPPESIHADG